MLTLNPRARQRQNERCGVCFFLIIIIILSAKSLLTRHLIKGDRPNTADLELGVMTDLSEGLCTEWLPIK